MVWESLLQANYSSRLISLVTVPVETVIHLDLYLNELCVMLRLCNQRMGKRVYTAAVSLHKHNDKHLVAGIHFSYVPSISV